LKLIKKFYFYLEKIGVSIYNIFDNGRLIIRKEKLEIYFTKVEAVMATKDKNIWILLVFILSGIVLGGLLGELAGNISWLWWLGYGEEFGIPDPITLDFSVIKISFSLLFKINIASIIGIAIAVFVYRKV
jgi:hypothetical protein